MATAFTPKNNPAFILHGKLDTSYGTVSRRRLLTEVNLTISTFEEAIVGIVQESIYVESYPDTC